jgi:4-hydroxy-tetrahydrodipicolinate reductase
MKIALLGYGKMGKTIEKLALEKGHIIVYTSSSEKEKGTFSDAEVAIEFSTPEVAVTNIKRCFEAGIPVVSGTTGWLSHYTEILNFCEERNGSFIYASNFSVGVNLFFNINEKLAKLMEPWKEYAVSIEEIHHTQKKDAPSGTAISIAEGIIKNSENNSWKLKDLDSNTINEKEIGIEAKRIDDVKGTHIVSYKSNIDTISISHKAHSREGFALGAILASEWIINKKGVYSMKDVLKIK